jgi:hypothetical protein
VIGTLVVTSDVCLLRERGARGVLKDKPLLSSASGTLDRVRAAGGGVFPNGLGGVETRVGRGMATKTKLTRLKKEKNKREWGKK